MSATPNIKGLLREDINGDITENLLGGILPVLDGSNLTGVIGNTYVAPIDPAVTDDATGSSLTFTGTKFGVGQKWFNYTTEELFVCVSSASGAARWNRQLQSNGANFLFLGGNTSIVRGAVVRLDNSGSEVGKSVVIPAVAADEAVVGVAASDASGSSDVTFQVISLGITKVLVDASEGAWVRGDPIYLHASLAGKATNAATAKLIGFASKEAASGLTLRDIFIGVGSGGGGGGDLHTVVQNRVHIDQDYTIENTTAGGTADYNGIMAGPVIVDPGKTLTVPVGSRLVIV